MSTPEAKTPSASTSRGRFIKRAVWAGVLIIALLLGLWWLERTPQTPPETPPPAPIADAAPPPLPRGAPPMPSAAEVEASIAEPPSDGEDTPAAPERTSAPALVDAAERADDAPPPAEGSPRLVLGRDSAAPAEPVAAAGEPRTSTRDIKPSANAQVSTGAAPAKAPAEAKAPDAAKAQVTDGYLVQLGVFVSPDNARALHDKVEALGIPTRIESRVVVGPFRNRVQAKEAREKLRTSGLGKGLVLPSR